MITIYRETVIKSNCDEDFGDETHQEDRQIVENEADDYINFLVKKMTAMGNRVQVDNNKQTATCFYTDTQGEWDDIMDLPSFWEWYN